MVKQYDVTMKALVELRPGDWLSYLGLPTAEVEVVEAELSTVSLAADKVLRVRSAFPWLLHLEFQSGHDVTLLERTLQYNVLLHARYKLPVQSIIILLSEGADRGSLTGILQRHLPDERLYLEFRYQVVRVWQKPVEEILTGGLGTLPLAPIADVTLDELPAVIRRMEARLRQEATPEEAGKVWTATNVLMGLRYSEELARQLLQGVQNMKESVTYQAIVREGREEEARSILLRQGTKRFGIPSEQHHAAITSIVSLDRLEELSDRMMDVESWQELLQDL